MSTADQRLMQSRQGRWISTMPVTCLDLTSRSSTIPSCLTTIYKELVQVLASAFVVHHPNPHYYHSCQGLWVGHEASNTFRMRLQDGGRRFGLAYRWMHGRLVFLFVIA